MTINIMNEYIELTKKQISTYLKLVFENAYDKKYNDIYSEIYINARYYNFYSYEENKTTRKIILEQLKKTQDYIISNNFQD